MTHNEYLEHRLAINGRSLQPGDEIKVPMYKEVK